MQPAPSHALFRQNAPRHDLDLSSSHAAAPASEPATFDFHTTTWQADGFGFDATSGEFFTASPTALAVMQCLGARLTTAQILDSLTATFDVNRRTAERDLEAFLAELTQLGLA